jgi:outer membrane receptor protein involved in Fe transport
MANYIDETSKNRPYLSDGPLNANNGTFLAPNVDESLLNPGYDPTSPKGSELQWTDDIYVTNPWFVVNRLVNNVDRKRLLAAMTARYNFTDWLYLQGRLGYDNLSDRYFQVNPTGLAYSQNEMGSLGNLSTVQTLELNPDVLAGIRRNITKDIGLDLSLGAALRKRRSEAVGVNGGPFIIPFLYSPYNVGAFGRSYGLSRREAHSAYYSLDLSYKNFLTLTTTGRYDTYSTLPSSNRDIFTPSVSGSFVFSELTHIPALTYGKLRASYSQTSGDPTSEYITQQYYSVGNSINGVTTGSFSSSLPNLFLKPYTLDEIEVGTELKFLKNRLGVDIAYFHRKTQNEIINGNLSPSTGYTSQYIGTGSTQNQGVEVSLTGEIAHKRDFGWNASLNFTNVQNKILDIYGNTSTNNQLGFGGTYRPLNASLALIKGMPGPQIMAYDWLRDASGKIIVNDNGVPQRTANQMPMGSTLPKVYGGLNNEFTYKKFNFSFLIDYKFGNKVLSATEYYAIYRGLDKMTLNYRETGVVVDGVYQNGSKNTTNIDAQTYYQALAAVSKYEVLDGSFIKFRQVTLGYSFDQSSLGKLPFESITLSLVARNLFYFVKHTDNIDPESAFSADIRYSGIEGTSLPSTRTYGINVNIKFKK